VDIQKEWFKERQTAKLAEADAIIFDVDDWIERFNIKCLKKGLFEIIIERLNKDFDYPAAVLSYDFEKLNVMPQGGVWDIHNGTVL
jgi:hypothetical protein